MRNHTKIEAWKLADDLVVTIYEGTRAFPREETYGLTSQLRRAAVSAPANIAEGSARGTKKDYLHFLYIARGSLVEVQYLVHLSGRLRLIDDEQAGVMLGQAESASRCLQGLIRSVEKESGKIARAIATATGTIALCFSTLGASIR